MYPLRWRRRLKAIACERVIVLEIYDAFVTQKTDVDPKNADYGSLIIFNMLTTLALKKGEIETQSVDCIDNTLSFSSIVFRVCMC